MNLYKISTEKGIFIGEKRKGGYYYLVPFDISLEDPNLRTATRLYKESLRREGHVIGYLRDEEISWAMSLRDIAKQSQPD